MDHTVPTPGSSDGRDDPLDAGPVANPRRTRLGADGRPVPGPVTSPADLD